MNLGGNSRFSLSAQKDISRSIFDRSNSLLTSFSAGKLIPIYVDEVLPGDTVTMDMSSLVRMSTPLYPVMDNAYFDTFWFFIPNRLVWNNWKYFMGESRDAWDDETEYEIPEDRFIAISRGSNGNYNVYDYFGLPMESTGSESGLAAYRVSALFRRAYQLVWNEWFRDENLQDSILIDKDDVGVETSGDPDDVPDAFKILSVNKYKDYFTSCLPSPQRGSDVLIPGAGGVISGEYPVYAGATNVPPASSSSLRLAYGLNADDEWAFTTGNLYTNENGLVTSYTTDSDSTDTGRAMRPVNLWAYVEGAGGTSATINDLRRAFAVQRLLEADARGGTRYRELVKSHFGVDVGDVRVQVPEYLGGAHIPINVNQVIQQSSTASEPSPLGETGAFSKTVYRSSMFTKSFVEHGILLGLCCVRTDHSYQQGINRLWSRRNRLDFYWPELANIGEQAVLNKELYATGGIADDEVFGYQEAWADYRYRPNLITGEMRQRTALAQTRQSLSQWHYGDFYSSLPSLSDEWIQETPVNIARTLAIQDDNISDQFFGQMYFRARWARPMPLYSIPGLSGHF